MAEKLLDTNAAVAVLNGDAAIQKSLTRIEKIFIPAIVLGELYFGAYQSSRVEANLLKLDQFYAQHVILPCDALTAQHYGRIRRSLKAKGRPIPENDIWIAAIARQHNLTLVTRDQHFKEVEGLTTESW